MGIQITIQDNTFKDNSSVMNNCTFIEKNGHDEYSDLARELAALKKRLNTNDKLYEAIASLEKALREKDKPKISKVILNYASEFSQTFFTGIASSALLTFISNLS